MAEETLSRIRDARGRSVTQLDPVRLHVWHQYNVIDEDTLHTIVEDLEPGTAKFRRRAIIIVPSAIAAIALLVLAVYCFSDASARRDLISTITNPVIMGPNLLCCLLVPWITARQARLKRVRFAMLKHRRCPHCGYDLRMLPVAAEDGATVCPECGCAWVIDEAAMSERLAATAAVGLGGGKQSKTVIAVMLALVAAALLGALMFAKML
jgi:hypothetical protein